MEVDRSDLDNVSNLEQVALDQLTNYGTGEVPIVTEPMENELAIVPAASGDGELAVNSAYEQFQIKV